MTDHNLSYILDWMNKTDQRLNAMERTGGVASPSETGCPTRAAGSPGDPQVSSLEAALSDQAEAMGPTESLNCFEAWEDSEEGHLARKRMGMPEYYSVNRRYGYSCFLAGIEAQQVRIAAAAQSAAHEAQGDCRYCGELSLKLGETCPTCGTRYPNESPEAE